MRVAWTGGTGRIGRVAREALQDHWDDVVVLVLPGENPSRFGTERIVVGDVRDRDSLAQAFKDVDVVIHLAGIPDEAPTASILDVNVVGTTNVYEVARDAGVRRIVFASSNHAVGFYPTETVVDPGMPVRPDTLYGVSKVYGEALARLHHDKWGTESVCLRIGSWRDRPGDQRQLATWLSPRDGVALLRAAVDAPDVGFQVVFGVSANQRSWWDSRAGNAVLGWQPQDDAEDYLHEVVGTSADVPPTLQGGAFTAHDYRGGLG